VAGERPNILQIIPRLDTGGAELSTIEIASAVTRAGGRALVATEGGRLAERLRQAGGELVPLSAASKNPLAILANARRIERLVREQAVDLLHARSRAPAWSALLAARRARVPLVTTYHGAYGEQGRLKRLYNSVMARADRVIANSEFTAGLIRARYGTRAERIAVIRRGVDLSAFDPRSVTPERMTDLRRQWGIADTRPIILQAARLTGWKGHRVLIEAADLLRQKGRLGPVAVVMAGDAQGRDDYKAGLTDEAQRRGLGEIVILPGHVADIAAAFRTAHVTVIASIEPEAFGRTATEAQAMGCPVIATDIGAPRETVLAASAAGPGAATGWLVPPGDATALACALAEALALDPAARAAMGERARAHVAGCFAIGAMQRATLAVYDSLLGTDLASRFDQATSQPSSESA
jgi:glycosyltransferase involved in cell wall biosynthesis